VTPWTREQASLAAHQPVAALPVIGPADLTPVDPARDVWDMWPVADRTGQPVRLEGREWWFFLAVDRAPDPEARHDAARIHLYSLGADGWRHHGAAFPPGLAPGTRQWSGTAVLHEDGATVTMHFTAAGRGGAGEDGGARFEQRLFATAGRLEAGRLSGWTRPVETARADGRFYLLADETEPLDDRIKGFRDPGYFRDPETGREHLLFTGSAAWRNEVHDGVIGLATLENGAWRVHAPLVDATGTNSEMERPHLVAREGLLYLFWSTQGKRFAPGIGAPTGLYGMVAERMEGPWRPLNNSGLVAANPAAEPHQAYCWWVVPDGRVISFADYWGLGPAGRPGDEAGRRARFGGTAAPFFRLALEGDRALISVHRASAPAFAA
jgi:levansucrase